MNIVIILLILFTIGLTTIIIKLNLAIKNLKISCQREILVKPTLSIKDAQNIILEALSTAYSKIDAHPSTYHIKIQNKKIRSAIIGVNGRNLRLLENLSSSSITFDNNNDNVIISCFNPIKREIAINLIKDLINSNKINANVIENLYQKHVKEIDSIIFKKGQEAFEQLNIKEKNKDTIYNIGKLYFRYSYGQNVLAHSIETARIMASIARKFNLDENLSKRAGLFHDIGKAFDIEKDGSHVDLGVEYAKSINESNEVINAIASHHGDIEANTVISSFVQFADKLSAARPAARKLTQEKLLTRIAKMEELAKNHGDVKDAFVIKGGKEIRVIIKPKSNSVIADIALTIKQKIENKLKFPGVINIVVIKENKYSTEAIQKKPK